MYPHTHTHTHTSGHSKWALYRVNTGFTLCVWSYVCVRVHICIADMARKMEKKWINSYKKICVVCVCIYLCVYILMCIADAA